jgi:osmotically-inducible protein OsmY
MAEDVRLAYIAENIEQRISTDERANALDISVAFIDGKLVLSGQTYCESRKRDIEQVARELAPADIEILNQIAVTRVEGSIDEEIIE